MAYSNSAAWIVAQMAEGGGALSDFDGKCIAVVGESIVADGNTPTDVHQSLSNRGYDPTQATFFRVNMMSLL